MTIILCMSHHHFCGTHHLFVNFTSPHKERDFAAGSIVCRDLPIPALDDLEEIWEFWADET